MILFARFDQFELESQRNCGFDYLELREGASSDGPLIGRWLWSFWIWWWWLRCCCWLPQGRLCWWTPLHVNALPRAIMLGQLIFDWLWLKIDIVELSCPLTMSPTQTNSTSPSVRTTLFRILDSGLSSTRSHSRTLRCLMGYDVVNIINPDPFPHGGDQDGVWHGLWRRVYLSFRSCLISLPPGILPKVWSFT